MNTKGHQTKLDWIKSDNGEGNKTWNSRAGTVSWSGRGSEYKATQSWVMSSMTLDSLELAQSHLEIAFFNYGTEIVELFGTKVVEK